MRADCRRKQLAPPCAKARGLTAEDLIEGADFTAAASLTLDMLDADAVVTY